MWLGPVCTAVWPGFPPPGRNSAVFIPTAKGGPEEIGQIPVERVRLRLRRKEQIRSPPSGVEKHWDFVKTFVFGKIVINEKMVLIDREAPEQVLR